MVILDVLIKFNYIVNASRDTVVGISLGSVGRSQLTDYLQNLLPLVQVSC